MNLISQEESIKSLVKKIKQKRDSWRNLKGAYISYNEYLAETIDNSMKYSEYVAENLSSVYLLGRLAGESIQESISYSEYLSEKIK
jgi:hypothetical protein